MIRLQKQKIIKSLLRTPISTRCMATSSPSFPKLSNELSKSQSPYLRAQSKSPVAWQEWTPKTLSLASSFNRPLFLSIGYKACHWCNVMSSESFSDPNIAKIINENFIPVKVDRDERQDIGLLYAMYHEVTNGVSGWPLNLFLEPSTLAPFFGGMYWPSSAAVALRYSQTHKKNQQGDEQENNLPPSFEAVINSVANAWKTSSDKCLSSANAIKARLHELHRLQNGSEKADFQLSVFEDVWSHFYSSFDPQFGGFSKAPKFPCPHNLSFLIKYSDLLTPQEYPYKEKSPLQRHDMTAREMASFSLKKMGEGAIKDQIGRGFHHSSITDDWSLPHFEKLLIDQSLLLSSFVYAYQSDPYQNSFSIEFIKDLVEYMTTSIDEGGLKTSVGGLIASEDADSIPAEIAIKKTEKGLDSSDISEEQMASDPSFKYVSNYKKIEGAFYVWQYNDLEGALERLEGDVAEAYYNIRDLGNINEEFDVHHDLAYQNTLYRSLDFEKLGQYFGMPPKTIEEMIKKIKTKLLKHRFQTRDRPSLDYRIFTGWNGAAVNALANTAIAMGATIPLNSKSTEYLTANENASSAHNLELFELGHKALKTAEEIVDFIYKNMFDATTGTLYRTYDSKSQTLNTQVPGMSDDYSYLIQGLLSLYTATFNSFYLDFAKVLQDTQLIKFWDQENGGFYFSDEETAQNSRTFLRFKPSFDSAEPSSNGVSCENLLKISGFLHDAFYMNKAVDILNCYGKDISAQPFGYCSMLGSLAAILRKKSSAGSMTSVFIVGGEHDNAKQESLELMHRLRQRLYNNHAEGAVQVLSNEESDTPSLRIPSIFPNLAVVRLTQADVEKYFESYGNTLYGALVDKYGGQENNSKMKFFVARNFSLLPENGEGIEEIEQVLDLVFTRNK